MKVAINTRLLIKNKLDGIGWYTYEIVKRMTKNNPNVEFILYFDRKHDDEYHFGDNVSTRVIAPQARHPILYNIWFNYSIVKYLKRDKPDVFFSPDGYLSQRTSTKQVATIHDLNFEHRPQDLKRKDLNYYKTNFPKFAEIAEHIITVSNFSKNDISELYGINTKKISVVHNGVNDNFKPLSNEEIKNTQQKYSSGNEFLLCMGSVHPRKNIVGCIKSFDVFKQKTNSPFKLVFAGNMYHFEGAIKEAFDQSSFKNDILFLGRTTDEETFRLMGSAHCLLYLSHFEGFGMPILEAFKANTPVICSNNSSIPEVAGQAALSTNQDDYNNVANCIEKLQDTDLRSELILAGKERLEQFSWDRAAAETFNIIKNVAAI